MLQLHEVPVRRQRRLALIVIVAALMASCCPFCNIVYNSHPLRTHNHRLGTVLVLFCLLLRGTCLLVDR